MHQSDHKQLENAIAIFQSGLSEKLSIIANSTTFVDFLRSGKETRKELLPDLLYELSNVNFEHIVGMAITDKDHGLLFKQGTETNYPITLSLCYLNRALHEMGECNYYWKLYLLKKDIMQELQRINSAIEKCQHCSPVNFLNNDTFGSFSLQNIESIPLKIKIKEGSQYVIYFYTLFILLILITFTIWNRYKIKHLVNRYIADPIETITNTLFSGKAINNNQGYIGEIDYLINQLKDWQNLIQKTEDQKHEAAIGRLASQVVHDIRSPLTALDIAIKDTASIPEAERLLIRKAALRIHDIANNLLTQYRQKNSETKTIFSLKPELIADIFMNVISEKRIQVNKNIEFMVTIDENTYGTFANVISSELQRALSNLISNAIEAIDKEGLVILSLTQNNSTLSLSIQDNGCGIAKEILPSILNGQLSLKKEGAGLGLARAKETIEAWNCQFQLESTVDVGTCITLLFPIIPSPNWFTAKLVIPRGSLVVVADDDASIHAVWNNRFKCALNDNDVSLIQIQRCAELSEWHFSNSDKACIYLVDYEFSQTQENGLSIIEKLGIGNQARLVTSHYENEVIQKQSQQLGTPIIPKHYAAYIPIEII